MKSKSGLNGLGKEQTVKYQIFLNQKQIEIELQSQATIKDLIEESIKNYREQKEFQQISLNCLNYKVFQAKKSGLAKDDYPPFDQQLSVKFTTQTKFCISIKDDLNATQSFESQTIDNKESLLKGQQGQKAGPFSCFRNCFKKQ